ncbi:MAG: hypothetical protein GXY83_42830 [Rhodopirellula sp.]|jgi:hypothetical protein|nr:hypothetical protein [Rhodopirellula sp.]
MKPAFNARWWYLSGKAAVPLDAMAAVVPWPPCPGRPEVNSYTWRRGDAPVKMIHKREGFCLLSGIGGGFHGGGEQVEIAIGVDEFWYLRGQVGTIRNLRRGHWTAVHE